MFELLGVSYTQRCWPKIASQKWSKAHSWFAHFGKNTWDKYTRMIYLNAFHLLRCEDVYTHHAIEFTGHPPTADTTILASGWDVLKKYPTKNGTYRCFPSNSMICFRKQKNVGCNLETKKHCIPKALFKPHVGMTEYHVISELLSDVVSKAHHQMLDMFSLTLHNYNDLEWLQLFPGFLGVFFTKHRSSSSLTFRVCGKIRRSDHNNESWGGRAHVPAAPLDGSQFPGRQD